jgi:hypothetical protein
VLVIEIDGQLTEEAILVYREMTATGVKVTIAGPLAEALEAWKGK